MISGPSGVGKDAVIKELIRRRSNLHFVVTATTRQSHSLPTPNAHLNNPEPRGQLKLMVWTISSSAKRLSNGGSKKAPCLNMPKSTGTTKAFPENKSMMPSTGDLIVYSGHPNQPSPWTKPSVFSDWMFREQPM